MYSSFTSNTTGLEGGTRGRPAAAWAGQVGGEQAVSRASRPGAMAAGQGGWSQLLGSSWVSQRCCLPS